MAAAKNSEPNRGLSFIHTSQERDRELQTVYMLLGKHCASLAWPALMSVFPLDDAGIPSRRIRFSPTLNRKIVRTGIQGDLSRRPVVLAGTSVERAWLL